MWGRKALQMEASFCWAGTSTEERPWLKSPIHHWKWPQREAQLKPSAGITCSHTAFQSVPSSNTIKQPQFPVLRTPDARQSSEMWNQGCWLLFQSRQHHTTNHHSPPQPYLTINGLCMIVIIQNKMKASRSASVSNSKLQCSDGAYTQGDAGKTFEHLLRVLRY